MKIFFLTILICLINGNDLFGQSTLSFTSSKDAYTISNLANNFGTTITMEAGIYKDKLGNASFRRSYVYFPVSNIPSNAVVISATLEFAQASGYTNSVTDQLYAERVTQNWVETIIQTGSEPTVSTGDAVISSTYFSGKRTFDVTSHVQNIVNNTYTNNGWRIRYYNEAQTSPNRYIFSTRETTNDPVLNITFFVPLSVENAEIQHCTTTNSDDGEITPTFVNGTGGSYTYTWTDANGNTIGGNTPSLSGVHVPYGWYGLHAESSIFHDDLYMAFLVGVQCETVKIEFNPGPKFIDDAYTRFNTIFGGGSGLNYGNNDNFLTERYYYSDWQIYTYYSIEAWMRHKLWVDSEFTLEEAELSLFGNGHDASQRSNESEIILVTQDWNESLISGINFPSTSNGVIASLSATSGSNDNKIVNVKDFWDLWKSDNTVNYGYNLQLTSFANPSAKMQFFSSDYTTDISKRPTLNFTLSLKEPYYTCVKPYGEIKKKLSGEQYPTKLNRVYFYYDEEYTSNTNLRFIIRDMTNNVMFDNTTVSLNRAYGDNRYYIELGTLASGTYVLEVINEKEEKFYLRFQKPL